MEEANLYYSQGKQKRLGFLFLGMSIVGILLALYMWMYADPILLMVLVGGIVLGVLGLAMFVRLALAPNREGEVAIRFTQQGINAKTTPVAKAAEMIEWSDIIDIQIFERELMVLVGDPGKYAERMKRFFVRDTFLKANKGYIRISFIEVDTSAEEIGRLVERFENSFHR